MSRPAFLAELKRRRVFCVAAAYAAIAFVIAQAADIFLPGIGLPEWSLRLVLTLLVLGFSIVLVLAWLFDATPQGVVRREPLAEDGGSAAGVLKQALAQGRPFAASFHTDPDLALLRDYPPFLELLKPKG